MVDRFPATPNQGNRELPSVAVVIPCFNGEQWIARAIKSIQDQEYGPLEIIVIDDGSTDQSLRILRSYDEIVKWKTGPNLGACAARNAGLRISTSEYILFLDADDYLSGPYIQGLASRAYLHGADMALGQGIEEFSNGSRRERHFYAEPGDPIDLLADILSKEALQTSQILWRKSFLEKIGGWNEAVVISQDIEISVRALLESPKLISSRHGYCVWDRHVEPSLSKAASRRTLESGLNWFDGVRDRFIATGHPRAIACLANMYYSLAKMSYAAGYTSIGDGALMSRKKLGYFVHEGSFISRLASRLIGLRSKILLGKAIRRALAMRHVILPPSGER